MDIKRSYVRACAGLPVVLVLLAVWGFVAKVKVNMGVMSVGLLVAIGLWVLIDRLTQGIIVEVDKKSATRSDAPTDEGAEESTDVIPQSTFDDFAYDGGIAR